MKSFTKMAIAGAAFASANAFAGIDLPINGNGELTLFVRDTSTLSQETPRIFAIDLSVNMDDILSQAQIQATSVPGDSLEYEARKELPFEFSYSLPGDAVTSNANLAQFLSVPSGSGYDFAIVAGDYGASAVGDRRYLQTTAIPLEGNNIRNGALNSTGTGFQGLTNAALSAESDYIDEGGGFTTSSKFGLDGYSSSVLINGGAQLPDAMTRVGEAASLYVWTSAGGTSGLFSRMYHGLDIRLNMNGTLEVLGGDTPAVPLPAAVWLFGSALAGIGALSRRRKLTAV